MVIWLLGFMFADLGIEKYTDVQKVKHYAETIREDQSDSHHYPNTRGSNSNVVDSNRLLEKGHDGSSDD